MTEEEIRDLAAKHSEFSSLVYKWIANFKREREKIYRGITHWGSAANHAWDANEYHFYIDEDGESIVFEGYTQEYNYGDSYMETRYTTVPLSALWDIESYLEPYREEAKAFRAKERKRKKAIKEDVEKREKEQLQKLLEKYGAP